MAEVTAFRNNALPYPVYGVPWTIVFPILDADGDPVTGATCDSERSLNGDTGADCTNEGTEITFTTATNKGLYYLTLTAAEMTADIVAATIYPDSGKATPVVLYPRKLVTLRSGTAAGGAAGYITLDTAAGGLNDKWNGCLCVATIDSNVEARIIDDYTGSNQQASVTPNWNVTPDSDDTFVIYQPEGMQIPMPDSSAVAAVYGRDVWFVRASPDGDSGNSGTNWDDAFDAVADAVTACSAGDMIVIGPGTYTETVDASGKANIEFVGAGLQTHITTATNSALTVASGTSVRKIQLTSTDTDSGDAGIVATSAVDVVLEDLKITGTYDGALCNGATRLRMNRCHVIGTFDCMNIQSAEDVLITKNIFETDGSLNAASDSRVLYAGAVSPGVFIGSGIIRDCVLTCSRAAETAKAATAFGVVSSGSHYTLQDCTLIAIQDHASSTGVATGVSSEDGTGSDGDVQLVGCQIHTRHDNSGTEYHLIQSSGVLAVDATTYYDTTKTGGTITTLPQNLPSGIEKNTALANFSFLMVASSDHYTGKTGLTVTAQISKDGGAFATCTNAVAEVSNGVYKHSLTATEMNADVVVLKYTGTGADQRTITMVTDS